MKNFRLVENNIDVRPFLQEIASVPDAWSLNAGRQQKIAVQREASAIPIRGLRKSMVQGRNPRDVHESRFTTISRQFPRIKDLLVSLGQKLDSDLARAKIVRLPPGGKVYPHIDRGEYYRHRDRYHLVFTTAPGNTLRCEEESVHMRVGELWWFDNKREHSAVNESDVDRVHFIFDLRSKTATAQEQAAFADQSASHNS